MPAHVQGSSGVRAGKEWSPNLQALMLWGEEQMENLGVCRMKWKLCCKMPVKSALCSFLPLPFAKSNRSQLLKTSHPLQWL